MLVDVNRFRSSGDLTNLTVEAKITGKWPENLVGHVYIIAPFHRPNDRHLFAGEGVIAKWDLQPQENKIIVHSRKLKTWDGFWHALSSPLSDLLPEAFFPARIGLIGVGELANTAIINLDGRLLLTADAGRYWEVDAETLETITPVGYFDEHIVSIPLSFFPLVANTAHPFYDPDEKQLITCELKSFPRIRRLFADMVSSAHVIQWDGEGTLKNWRLDGASLDGSSHTVMVTKESIMIPDMPFQMGVATLLGLKVAPEKAYPKTQIHLVNRDDLQADRKTVPSRLITFAGDSYHFLWNYHQIESKIYCVAVQQATLSVSDAIKPRDVEHFTGDRYNRDYYGIPWMFGFDPGVLRKVAIQDAEVVEEEAFIHPGWFSTTLFTADPREQFTPQGYSAIYQAYGGYHRALLSRRQYLCFRDHPNRILTDEQLPDHDLPSVLAKVPWSANWQELTEKIANEQAANPDTHVSHLGKGLVDFYVFPEGYILDSVQFIPHEQNQGYIFATVLSNEGYQGWLFNKENLNQGVVAKLSLPADIDFGFTLHSDYFEKIIPRKSNYNVNRLWSAMRSLTRVPGELLINRLGSIIKGITDK